MREGAVVGVASIIIIIAATTEARAGSITIASPRDGGVVLGDVLRIEVANAPAPPACAVDGASASPRWMRLPYPGQWVGEVTLRASGAHELVVATGASSARVKFTSRHGGSVAIGDEVARAFLAAHPLDRQQWQWGPAVFGYGLSRLAQVSPDRARDVGALSSYYSAWLARGLPKIDRPDVCASALGALAIDRWDGVASARPAARAVARYIAREPRDRLGAIDHLGANSFLRHLADASVIFRPWARSIWVDSLMMYGVFAAQWGNAMGDRAMLDFAADQPAIFANVLEDPASGLFEHAYDWDRRRTMGTRWLRGNGWVATSIVEILDELPHGHPRRAELEAILAHQSRGFSAMQMPNGMWDSIADSPGAAYPESSGSALAAYALAKGARRGILPPAARASARRTFEALCARLRSGPNGPVLTGTSGATNPYPAWAYSLIAQKDDVDYGVGAFLLLASELENERW